MKQKLHFKETAILILKIGKMVNKKTFLVFIRPCSGLYFFFSKQCFFLKYFHSSVPLMNIDKNHKAPKGRR